MPGIQKPVLDAVAQMKDLIIRFGIEERQEIFNVFGGVERLCRSHAGPHALLCKPLGVALLDAG